MERYKRPRCDEYMERAHLKCVRPANHNGKHLSERAYKTHNDYLREYYRTRRNITMVQLNLRVDESLRDDIREYCSSSGRSQADVLQTAIQGYLKGTW